MMNIFLPSLRCWLDWSIIIVVSQWDGTGLLLWIVGVFMFCSKVTIALQIMVNITWRHQTVTAANVDPMRILRKHIWYQSWFEVDNNV